MCPITGIRRGSILIISKACLSLPGNKNWGQHHLNYTEGRSSSRRRNKVPEPGKGEGVPGRRPVREPALFDVQPDSPVPKGSTIHPETTEARNKAKSMILFSWSHFKWEDARTFTF